MLQTIQKVLNTLELIEVKGKNNVNYMLGCILTLEQMAEEIARVQKSAYRSEQVDAKVKECPMEHEAKLP